MSSAVVTETPLSQNCAAKNIDPVSVMRGGSVDKPLPPLAARLDGRAWNRPGRLSVAAAKDLDQVATAVAVEIRELEIGRAERASRVRNEPPAEEDPAGAVDHHIAQRAAAEPVAAAAWGQVAEAGRGIHGIRGERNDLPLEWDQALLTDEPCHAHRRHENDRERTHYFSLPRRTGSGAAIQQTCQAWTDRRFYSLGAGLRF